MVPGSADPEWRIQIEKSVHIYDHQVVFDIKLAKDTYLTDWPFSKEPPTYLGTIASGTTTVVALCGEGGSEEVSIDCSIAVAHSLGFISAGNTTRKLPMVTKLFQPFSFEASYLTDEIVFGKEKVELGPWSDTLDTEGRKWGAPDPQKVRLYAFLQSRNYKGTSSDSWLVLAKKVRDRLRLEDKGRQDALKAGSAPPPTSIFIPDAARTLHGGAPREYEHRAADCLPANRRGARLREDCHGRMD